MVKKRLIFTIILSFSLILRADLAFSGPNDDTLSTSELKSLSIEELLNIEVTSVSKRAEKLSETPSAIQVITGEEIRRSGATSIPEALQLASNLIVAQRDSRQWAISARGFNNSLSNKLLVMIDGRTIYTPLYAGVFWDAQHVLIEDIDRIEVISGPGGTLWGANAVNGIINILTKDANDTQGAVVSAGIGSQLEDLVTARYGGNSDSTLFFRVYGQRSDMDNTVFPDGQEAVNEWQATQGGFRVDWVKSPSDAISIQGDAYGGSIEQVSQKDTKIDGQNILGRFVRTISSESELQFQFFYDRTWRDIPGTFSEELQTFDFDFQHRLAVAKNQSLVWGASYRLMKDEIGNGPSLAFLPPDKDMHLFGGFVQDEITISPGILKLTLGTKLEDNEFTGLEVLPSARLSWTVDERQTIWTAVSRAVRSPSRIDAEFYAPPPPFPPGTPNLAGGPDIESEKMVAYELGYRVNPGEKVILSLATYFNSYDDLRSLEQTAPLTYEFRNGLKGESWGAELSGSFQLAEWIRLRGGYSYFHVHLWNKPGHSDLNQGRGEGNDPHNLLVLQSYLDLPQNIQVSFLGRYVDMLPNPHVPSYIAIDSRASWLYRGFEFSLLGRNLTDNRHPEFGAESSRNEVPRSVFGQIAWRK